jgi:hypothetical protein
MDTGRLVLFIINTVVLLVSTPFLVAAFFRRHARRWRGLGLWCIGLSLWLVNFGTHLYQEFWLDERLFVAASNGHTEQVKALLSAGANPNAAWEDGTSALSAARRAGHKDVVLILEEAGAAN